MKCDACGKKDVSEDAWIDSQPGDEKPGNPGEWKRIHLCEACWDRLEPDMWTCQDHYESLNPITPYDALPNLPEKEI